MNRWIVWMFGVAVGIAVVLAVRGPLQDLARSWWDIPLIGRLAAIACGAIACSTIEQLAQRFGLVRPQAE
jgi:hypothetical protein